MLLNPNRQISPTTTSSLLSASIMERNVTKNCKKTKRRTIFIVTVTEHGVWGLDRLVWTFDWAKRTAVWLKTNNAINTTQHSFMACEERGIDSISIQSKPKGKSKLHHVTKIIFIFRKDRHAHLAQQPMRWKWSESECCWWRFFCKVPLSFD